MDSIDPYKIAASHSSLIAMPIYFTSPLNFDLNLCFISIPKPFVVIDDSTSFFCVNGDALSCGLARLHGFIGGKPIQVTVSHGPGIEPCRCSGNTVLDA